MYLEFSTYSTYLFLWALQCLSLKWDVPGFILSGIDFILLMVDVDLSWKKWTYVSRLPSLVLSDYHFLLTIFKDVHSWIILINNKWKYITFCWRENQGAMSQGLIVLYKLFFIYGNLGELFSPRHTGTGYTVNTYFHCVFGVNNCCYFILT